jgi:hypothetical protein
MSAAPIIGPVPQETAQLAQNLARNCGYAVLPCGSDGQPLVPLRAASRLPLTISNMWLRAPGPLVGIATGSASGIWVLEVRVDGSAWWETHHDRLPHTRTYETPSPGLQLIFTHGHDIPCTSGRIHAGVDTFGDGGCIVHWFAASRPCLDPEPPAPFPVWLRTMLLEAPS